MDIKLTVEVAGETFSDVIRFDAERADYSEQAVAIAGEVVRQILAYKLLEELPNQRLCIEHLQEIGVVPR